MTKMNFNGQWIDNLYVDPHRGLGPGVENTTVKVGQSTGETFLHSTKNKRTIVVDYQIYGSTRRELELTLADKLYTDDVVPIIFSDKPNEVWYGKLDELPTMEKPGVSATGTFSLLVPDGLSHALTPTTADNTPYAGENLLVGTSSEWQSATAAANYNVFKMLTSGDDLRRLAGKTLTASVLINNTSSVPVRVQFWSSDTGVVSGNNIASGSTGISRVTFTAVNSTSSPNLVIAEKDLSTNAETVNYSTAKLQEGAVDEAGMNLLMGTKDFDGNFFNNLDVYVASGELYEGVWLRVSTNQQWQGITQRYWVTAGQQYTFSVYAKSNIDGLLCGIYTDASVLSSGTTLGYDKNIRLTTQTRRYLFTGNAEKDGYILPRMENPTANGKLWVGGYALKLGTDATHSPSPYDYAPNRQDDNYYADTIELTNHGTVPTPLHVTAEMRSDNGLLGLTLDDNFYQLGNIDEVDAVQLPPSEMIVPDGLAAFGSGKINDTAHQPLPPLMGALSQTGTIVKDANGINVTDYGTSSAKSWAGPSITWTFPAASDGKIGAKNFFLWQNNEFETDKKPEAGFQVHTVADKDGKRLFTAILLDQSGITNQSKIICFVNDNKVYESDNQWTGKGYRGFMSMTKSGNNFVIVYGNTTKTFVDTALTDSEGYYYTVGYGKWYNNPAPAHNYVINWNLRQDKIDAWKDVPNFLKAGDVVDLDSKTNTLTINDYPDWDRVDIASEPLLVPPGKSTLGIVYSTFAKPPKVTVDFEERWL